jgi:hypothetical protein
MFIQGYYAGNNSMHASLFSNGFSSDPTACDSITVRLHEPAIPHAPAVTSKALLHSNGNAEIFFPSSVFNHTYYISIRHRNSIETWSKEPVLFTSPSVSFDFAGQ